MLAEADIAALVGARHPDPFAVLGMHPDASGALWVRALLPGALRVELLDAAKGGVVVELVQRHAEGCFEARVPRRRKRFDYRLRIAWQAGGESLLADPYAFGALIPDDTLEAYAEGRHLRPDEFLGAHPMVIDGIEGVRFALWAPNARRVSVVGAFNQWDGRRHPMRLRHVAGVWEIFVPHAAVGDLYKYELLGAEGTLLPAKADPCAFAAELRPGTASRVALPPERRALPAERAAANRRDAPIAVYEVHAGSWRRRADGGFCDWHELAATLPAYAADLGFTHIELLPVSEHPFDGSWGYQPVGLYAPSARFGDPAGFVAFVDACHALGLGVIVDWVPAHFPNDGHGLARFDGTALYEYADPREGFHRDWNTLIPNFGRTEVRAHLVGSALHWLEHYGIDGLRVDAVASMLYRDYSRPPGEWVPNVHGGRENLEAIALLRTLNEVVGSDCPGAITIAEESTAFPGVSAPTSAGGLGFHYKWNMGWMNDTLRYIGEDPVHRRWHHDRLTFGLVYAFSENYLLPISHDEVVHGKRSLLGKMPGDDWQRFANLRCYLGFQWGHPGKKLLFMGQEFGQPHEWRHDEALPWHLIDDERHAGVQRWVRDLNRLYRERTALHRLDCEAAGFSWLVMDDRDQSVLAFARFDGAGNVVVVACNCTPVPRHGYRLPVPAGPGAWREALNSDSRHYGGSDLGNGAGPLCVDTESEGRAALTLTLPPLATLLLVPA